MNTIDTLMALANRYADTFYKNESVDASMEANIKLRAALTEALATLPTPEIDTRWSGTNTVYYTEAQMLALRAATVEACAKEADHWYEINKTHRCGDYIAAAIRGME